MNASQSIMADTSRIASAPKSIWRERRRVLVVSHDFPPNRTSAVYRMTGLTRALPELGWQPTVLTIRSEMSNQEPQLLEKLPVDLSIVRTAYWRVDGWERRTHDAIRDAGGLQSTASNRQPMFDKLVRSVGKLVRSTVYFPDETIGWVPHAFSEAMRLHQREPFDAVYTTSPPRAAPVIGLLLKLLCGIPWICEFMDPWYPPEGSIRRRSEDRLQAQLVRRADRVVVMVPQHAEDLGRVFRVAPEKFVVVRNGFFEEDFSFLRTTQRDLLEPGYFHLSHFGTIYADNAGKFFPALAELLRESPELKRRLRVNIGGHPSEDVLRWTHHADLREAIRLHGFTPNRTDVLRMMAASDCLLLFWGRPDFSRLAVAGKTYDYLRIGRPIMAVTCEGGVKELVEGAQAGRVVAPQDTEAIKQAVRAMATEERSNGWYAGPPRPEFVDQFRWDQQAVHLVRAFNEAASDGR